MPLVFHAEPDFTKLKAYIERSLVELSDGRRVKDFEHYVYELALEACVYPETLKRFYESEL
jgi:hypothetical protein